MNKELSDGAVKMLNFIRLPENHWNASKKELQELVCNNDDVQQWLENPKSKVGQNSGLFIYGKWGRGKSSLAAILAKELLGRGVFSLWVEYQNIAKYLKKETIFSGDQTMIERMEEVDLLIVNEFNPKTYQREFPIDCLEHVIRSRVAAKKPTIVTSNGSPKEFGQDKTKQGQVLYGMLTGLLSIFREACTPVCVKGEDKRKE